MELQRCYEILDIEPEASPEAVRQAYKAQVKFFHPDRFTDDPTQRRLAEERLKEVNAAYATLKTRGDLEPGGRPQAKAPASEDPGGDYSRPPDPSESAPPPTAGSQSPSLLHQLKIIGERVATGISKALANLGGDPVRTEQRGTPRAGGGCQREAAGPRCTGRRMGRGGGKGGGRGGGRGR